MIFTVIPKSDEYGAIPCRTLKNALRMKHCLLSKMNIHSTIQDGDGYVVSEVEQSAHIFDVFC